MLSIRSQLTMQCTIDLLADNVLRSMLQTRLTQLGNLIDLSHLLIVQPGDTAADAQNELGWSLLHNVVDELPYDHPDFTPSWEWIEHHSDWYEFVFIVSDDGFGIHVFVQDHPETDPDLLNLCRNHS